MKSDKGKNIVIGVLIGIIVGLAMLIGLLVTGKVGFNGKEELDEDINATNIKIDNTRKYVYDAEYKYDNKYNEYDAGVIGEADKDVLDRFGLRIEYSLGKLVELQVPYINLKSSDANKINKQLEKLYMEYAKDFDFYAEGASDPNAPTIHRQILQYQSYIYDGMLSVIVIYDTQATSSWVFNYDVYNFDLSIGNLMSFDEVLQKLDYDKGETIFSVKELLKRKMDSLYGSHDRDLSVACKTMGSFDSLKDNEKMEKSVSCYEKAYYLLDKSIEDGSVKFFVNQDGLLNVFAIPYYSEVQNGTIQYYLFKVNK